MANLKIYIEAIRDGSRYKLKLSDSEGNEGIDNLISNAKPGTKVKWQEKKPAKIKLKDITKIGAKDGSDDIFGETLRKVGKNWEGTVQDDMWDREEEYFIHYIIKGETQEHICDPVIKTPPPP